MDRLDEVKLNVYEAHYSGKIDLYDRNSLLSLLHDDDDHECIIIESDLNNNETLRELFTETCEVIESSMDRKVTSNYSIMNFGVYGNGKTDRGFGHDPYFKIFDGDDPKTSKNLVRISFYRPEYIVHEHRKWNLKSKEKNLLVKYLKAPYKNTDMTLWEKLLDEAKFELQDYTKNSDYPKWIKALDDARDNMPDYTKLKSV